MPLLLYYRYTICNRKNTNMGLRDAVMRNVTAKTEILRLLPHSYF